MEEQKTEDNVEFIEVKETELVEDTELVEETVIEEKKDSKLHSISKTVLSILSLLVGAYVGYRLGIITGVICAGFLSYTACVILDLCFKRQ